MIPYLHWQQTQLANAFPAILWEGMPPAGKASLPHYLPLAALTLHRQEPRAAPAGFQWHWVTLRLHLMAPSSHTNPIVVQEDLLGPLIGWLQSNAQGVSTATFALGQLMIGPLETLPAPAGAYACVLTLQRLVQTPGPPIS